MRASKARTGLRARLVCHGRWTAYGMSLPSHTRGGSRMRESRPYGSVRGARDETRVPTATEARVHRAVLLNAMEPNSLTPELETQLEIRTRELAETRKALVEALEQQTATSEVLRVISSSPGELGPVFQAMLANAMRVCEAKFGLMQRYDGDTWKIAAAHGA